jgi:hypothetical protein
MFGVEHFWGSPFFSVARRVRATSFGWLVENIDTRNTF